MLTFLKSLDMFGASYKFTFNREERFKHHVGGMFTLIWFAIAMYFVYALGSDIIIKDKPFVFQQSEYNYDTEITPSTNFGFSFQDWTSGVPIAVDPVNEGFLQISVDYVNGASITSYSGFEKCNITKHFPGLEKALFDQTKLSQAYCPQNPLIGKPVNCKLLDKDFFKRFVVKIEPCTNNVNKTNCRPSEDIESYFKNSIIQISIKYENHLYRPDSTDTKDPTKRFIYNDQNYLDIRFTKDQYYNFQAEVVKTDWNVIGFGSEDYNYQQFRYKYNINNARITTDKPLMKFILFASTDKIIENRRFMKLTDLTAQTGSLLNLISMLFSAWIKLLYKMRMKEILMNKVFYINANEENSLKLKNSGDPEEDQGLNQPINEEEKQQRIKQFEENLFRKKSEPVLQEPKASLEGKSSAAALGIGTNNGNGPIMQQSETPNSPSTPYARPLFSNNQGSPGISLRGMPKSSLNVNPTTKVTSNDFNNKLDISAIEMSPKNLNNNFVSQFDQFQLQTQVVVKDTPKEILPDAKVDIELAVNSNNQASSSNVIDPRKNIAQAHLLNAQAKEREREKNLQLYRVNSNKKIVEDKFNLLKPLTEKENLISSTHINWEKSVYLLSVAEYVNLICCKCLANKRIRDVHDTYNKLEPIISHYTDIVFNVRKTYDLEKMQYLLFDKTQFAIFNSNQKIENPMNLVAKGRFSQFYQFIKNPRAQECLFKEYCKNLGEKKQKKKTKLDRKLFDLIKN